MDARTTELQTVQQVMKQTKDKRMYERYQAIALFLQGYKYEQISAIIGRNKKTVGTYVKTYREQGLDGLVRHASPGAPHKLTLEQEQELVDIIVKCLPADVGFEARHNWTLALIVSLVEQKWQKTYTLRGMSRLLESLGLSYTKPTYTLAQADVEKQKAFQEEIFPALKKD
jgi:putative transposase